MKNHRNVPRLTAFLLNILTKKMVGPTSITNKSDNNSSKKENKNKINKKNILCKNNGKNIDTRKTPPHTLTNTEKTLTTKFSKCLI